VTLVAEPGTYYLDAAASINGSFMQFALQMITFAPPAQTGAGTNVSVTTAQFTSATVCIRRKLQGSNGLATFLRLYHFNESLPPAGQWEELPPPPGMEPAIDCAADLAACGCADEASCGIDYTADPPVSVVMVCGVTQSFSPFAVFEKDIEFTNKVNGQEYEGPTGPPAPRTWTWTVPVTGTYRITAIGAAGASATQAVGISGGCGARISGDFSAWARAGSRARLS
jgi:hypothetical protein